MQLLSVVCESSFVKTISWFASIATTPMICESMLNKKYEYACVALLNARAPTHGASGLYR